MLCFSPSTQRRTPRPGRRRSTSSRACWNGKCGSAGLTGAKTWRTVHAPITGSTNWEDGGSDGTPSVSDQGLRPNGRSSPRCPIVQPRHRRGSGRFRAQRKTLYPIEGRAELANLIARADRHSGPTVAGGEAFHPGSELAQRSEQRTRQPCCRAQEVRQGKGPPERPVLQALSFLNSFSHYQDRLRAAFFMADGRLLPKRDLGRRLSRRGSVAGIGHAKTVCR